MLNQLWLNLPCKDIQKATDFFTQIGFLINDRHSNPGMLSLFVGSNKVVVNFFPEKVFQEYIGGQSITKTDLSNEVLFSVGAESPEEVDKICEKVVKAGGILYGKPGYKDGWMYGCGFIDLDGHRWNLLYMDMTQIPKVNN